MTHARFSLDDKDREAAESCATIKFKHGYEVYDEQKRDGFLDGIEHGYHKGIMAVIEMLVSEEFTKENGGYSIEAQWLKEKFGVR